MRTSEKNGTAKTLRGRNKPSMLATTPKLTLLYVEVDPLSSDNATGFPELLAGPTVEILNF